MLPGWIAASKVMLTSREMVCPLKRMKEAVQAKQFAITSRTVTSVKGRLEKENAKSTAVLGTSVMQLQHTWSAPSF